jgi:tetratricopeptide (TPR) repeat protein
MKRTLASSFLAAAVALAIPALTLADKIELKDGRTLSGTLVREGSAMIIRTDTNETVTTTPDQILRVTLTNNITPAQAANAEWKTISIQIKKADTLAAVIALHQKFIDKHPNQELAKTVRTSLAEYQKLVGQKPVKFRGRWMAEAQVQTTQQSWQDQAKPALEPYRAKRFREALDSAKEILQSTDDNPIALTIAGNASFQINNLAAARQYFAKLAAADPSTPLPENNIAVLCARQKLTGETLLHYTKALQTNPANRLLLDNIAEALNTYLLTGGSRETPAYKDLLRQVKDPEERLQAEMAKKDLRRHGSGWVPKEHAERLFKARTEIAAAMGRLEAKYTGVRQSLDAIKNQISQTDKDIETTNANITTLTTAATDASTQGGADLTTILASRDTYVQGLEKLRTRKQSLEAERAKLTPIDKEIHTQAEKLKAALAAYQSTEYTGTQQLMELDEDQTPPAPVPSPKVAVVLEQLKEFAPHTIAKDSGPPPTTPVPPYDGVRIIPLPQNTQVPIGLNNKSTGGNAWGGSRMAGTAGPGGATLYYRTSDGKQRSVELPPGKFFFQFPDNQDVYAVLDQHSPKLRDVGAIMDGSINPGIPAPPDVPRTPVPSQTPATERPPMATTQPTTRPASPPVTATPTPKRTPPASPPAQPKPTPPPKAAPRPTPAPAPAAPTPAGPRRPAARP